MAAFREATAKEAAALRLPATALVFAGKRYGTYYISSVEQEGGRPIRHMPHAASAAHIYQATAARLAPEAIGD